MKFFIHSDFHDPATTREVSRETMLATLGESLFAQLIEGPGRALAIGQTVYEIRTA